MPRIINLAKIPAVWPLLLRAGMKGTSMRDFAPSCPLPTQRLSVPFSVDKRHHVKYAGLTGWTAPNASMHPCYPQVCCLPLHLRLMLMADFPFPLLGLIHIANKVQQYQPLPLTHSYQLMAYIDSLTPHTKGWRFDLVAEIWQQQTLCWQARATTLAKDNQLPKNQTKQRIETVTPYAQQQGCSLPANLGRRYARISGDYNPIHLYTMTAKLFGFKAHIAHGMWSLAHSLALLQPLLSERFIVTNRFVRPLLLPTKALFSYQQTDEALVSFNLCNQAATELHLEGQLVRR